MEIINLNLTPQQILDNPLLNKGTAFTEEERDSLGLHGWLPCHISTLEEQLKRRYANFCVQQDSLSKYLFLLSLQNRNEILFYRLVQEHITEMLPLIYTPTVGDVSLQFSMLYFQHRGLYLSYPLKDKMDAILSSVAREDIDVIVVTDGERILGLGDVGIGGMAIPQGKLALYTIFGGIHPSRTLPIMLDVGTNNPELLNEPLYLGWRHPRILGEEYHHFVHLFVQAIKKRFPKVLLQWEDFAKPHARILLEQYRDQIASFNDDIQGTAAVVLAGLLSAVKSRKGHLKHQKIVLFGGGSAGLGIAHLIVEAMQHEGCSKEESYRNFYVIDIDGLLHDQQPRMDREQRKFAHPFSEVSAWSSTTSGKISLLDVIKHAKPTILIGVSAQPNVFTEEIVQTMLSYTDHPIIFPLSNPNSRAEAQPLDLLQWTQGKAIIATGSPFPSVMLGKQAYPVAQCNNVYIFPGIGLGIVACKSPKVTEKMFVQAAHILSSHSPILKNPHGLLFPALENLRAISREIAIAVCQVAQEEGIVPIIPLTEIQQQVDRQMWTPQYPTFRKTPKQLS